MTGSRHQGDSEDRNAAFIAVAHQFRVNGFSPLPLSGKAPIISGWPGVFCERMPSLQEIEQVWSVGRRGSHVMDGVGVATADGLIILDIDDDSATERVLAIVPQARAAPACIGQRGRKIFMRASDGKNLRERNITGASTGGALEVLAWHRQAVVPPTKHPKTGRPFEWVDDSLTLLSEPLHCLPTISDADIDALRAVFSTPALMTVAPKSRVQRRPQTTPPKTFDANPIDALPDRWWEASDNRAKIEELFRLFGIVHRAARDQGGRITLRADGADAAGNPHRPETIDIDATAHWKHVVRCIVDVLGNTWDAFLLHVEVSRGNAMLGLPGGPKTYNAVGNKRFFDSVVDARTFEAKSGKRPRTVRTLQWWARMIEGRPPLPRHERKRGLVAGWRQAFARLQASGVEPNVAVARQWVALKFRSGSRRFAIINEALDVIASGGGCAWLSDIAGVAAKHGVSGRAVQHALSAAERAGILLRTRGNEGGKQILLTVPAFVDHDTDWNNLNSECSPSLLSEGGVWGGVIEGAVGGETAGQPANSEQEEDWPDWPEVEDGPPPAAFGNVRRPASEEDQRAFNELVEEARRGRCTEEILLLAGILPPEAATRLLHIVEQNRAGKKVGAKWLRVIAGEIGELVLSEPQLWPVKLQGALDYVADRLARTRGRLTPVKWARVFAENIGYVHERAGRLTPMARAARGAKQRREKALNTQG